MGHYVLSINKLKQKQSFYDQSGQTTLTLVGPQVSRTTGCKLGQKSER